MLTPLRASALAFAGSLLAIASPAMAQDYTLTEVSGKYVERNGAGSTYSLTDDAFVSVALPFDFFYYGRTWDSAYLHSNGYIQFAEDSPGLSQGRNHRIAGFSLNHLDGMIAPLWDDLAPDKAGASSVIASFTTGTSPNRTFIFSWEAMARLGADDAYWFQAQLEESTGRITLAYKDDATPSTWGTVSYSVGIEEPDWGNEFAGRFLATTTENDEFFHPGTDYQFDPVESSTTGRLLANLPVADETGIGNTVQLSEPLVGVEIRLWDERDRLVGTAFTDENGRFDVRALALNSDESGSLHVAAASRNATVGGSDGEPRVWELDSRVDLDPEHDNGTVILGNTNDFDESKRRNLFLAMAVQALFDEYGDTTTPAVPDLHVLYEAASTSPTAYLKRDGATPAGLRIGSAASGNDDVWDRSVISRVWARTFLDALTGFEGTTHTAGLEADTNAGNAFAEGFGAFLHAHFTGDTTLVDATGASTADTFDIESPGLGGTPSRTVAGWVAAALWDLRDGIDAETVSEAHDGVDGTATPNQVLTALDTVIGEALAVPFIEAWNDDGHEPKGLVTNFIHHGLLDDDDSEPNDSLDTATTLGDSGSIITNRVLNRFNEDWYLSTLSEPTPGLQVTVAYDRVELDTTIVLEIRDATTGQVLATGDPVSFEGPYVAVTGQLASGNYAIRVAHEGGVPIPTYRINTNQRLDVADVQLPDWTVGQPFLVEMPISGGVPPYRVIAESTFGLPPGLNYNTEDQEVRGIPSQAGEYAFVLQIVDDIQPPNLALSPHSLVINPEFVLGGASFIGVPLGVTSDIAIRRSGGTAPFTTNLLEGTLPAGLTLDPTRPEFTGTLDEMGSSPIVVLVTDTAQAGQLLSTTLVGCAATPEKNTPASLGAGRAATGYWVDALAGSSLSLKLKTSKKQAKRTLTPIVVDADGNEVVGGKLKPGKGKASFKKVVAPHTGRFFFIVSSDDGGDPTQLEATAKTAPAKKLAGTLVDLETQDTVEIEFGAFAGAVLKFQAKADKSGLEVGVQSIIAPSGAAVFGDPLGVVAKKRSVKLSRELNETGTWRIVLTNKGTSAGTAKYKLSLKQPKGAEFSLD